MTNVFKGSVLPASEQTRAIKLALSSLGIGDIASWDELDKLADGNRASARASALTARKQLLAEERMHFRTVVNVGVERLADDQVASEVVPAQCKSMVGAAKKMMKTTQGLVMEKVAPENRYGVIAHQTIAGVVVLAASKENKAKMIEAAKAEQALQPFTPRDAMRRLLGG